MAETNQEVETEEEIPLAGDVHELDHVPANKSPATPRDAEELWGAIKPSVTADTAWHFEHPRHCKCGATLRYGKTGRLCDPCMKGIRYVTFASLADADAEAV